PEEAECAGVSDRHVAAGSCWLLRLRTRNHAPYRSTPRGCGLVYLSYAAVLVDAAIRRIAPDGHVPGHPRCTRRVRPGAREPAAAGVRPARFRIRNARLCRESSLSAGLEPRCGVRCLHRCGLRKLAPGGRRNACGTLPRSPPDA